VSSLLSNLADVERIITASFPCMHVRLQRPAAEGLRPAAGLWLGHCQGACGGRRRDLAGRVGARSGRARPWPPAACPARAPEAPAPQVPALNIFESSLRRGKFDANRKLSNGALMEFAKIYPMDAVYDTPEDVPEDVRAHLSFYGAVPSQRAHIECNEQSLSVSAGCLRLPDLHHWCCGRAHEPRSHSIEPEHGSGAEAGVRGAGAQVKSNKRYAAAADQGFTMKEVADAVAKDFGSVDVLVHSLANGPEVTKPLLETSRKARPCPAWSIAAPRRIRPLGVRTTQVEARRPHR